MERPVSHFGDIGLLRTFISGHDHIGFEHDAFEADIVAVELVKDACERAFSDALTDIDGMVAVHEHLGLDDRYKARLLRGCGIPRQRVGVGLGRNVRCVAIDDLDDLVENDDTTFNYESSSINMTPILLQDWSKTGQS